MRVRSLAGADSFCRFRASVLACVSPPPPDISAHGARDFGLFDERGDGDVA